MPIVDRVARSAVLDMLDRAARHARVADLPEQTVMEGGALIGMMSRRSSTYGDGPPLHALNLIFVAEDEGSLDLIVKLVRSLSVES